MTDIIGEKEANLERKEMGCLSFPNIRFSNFSALFGPAEKNGDLRLSFYGYYYF